jgi:aldehyde dehydrogenase (NAD+)
LELGGKSPCIIDKGADLAYTASKMAFSCFFNFGQTCTRPDYILIDYTLVGKFVDELKTKMKTLHNDGKSIDLLGNAINDFHHERLCALFKDHQGTVVIGNVNAHIDKDLQPSVILNPSTDSPLMKDEIFGPIVPIITVKNIDEAIDFINNRPKPLATYYYGSNSRWNTNLNKVEKQTSSGAFVVNDSCT